MKHSLFLSKTWAIGKVTFWEIIRDKVLYNSLLCGAVLISLSMVASQLTYATQSRVIVNFGIALVTFSSVAIAILVSVPMFHKEIERRTAYVILSKPVSRFQFLIGKVTGLTMVVVSNWILLTSAFLMIYFISGGSIYSTLFWALFYILLQSLWAMVLSVMFSAYSTPSVAAIMTLGVYFIGSNISQIQLLSVNTQDSVMKFIFSKITWVMPNFEFFTLGMKTVYQIPLYAPAIFFTLIYAFIWFGILVFLTWLILERKEI